LNSKAQYVKIEKKIKLLISYWGDYGAGNVYAYFNVAQDSHLKIENPDHYEIPFRFNIEMEGDEWFEEVLPVLQEEYEEKNGYPVDFAYFVQHEITNKLDQRLEELLADHPLFDKDFKCISNHHGYYEYKHMYADYYADNKS
jgi:hypothetical protein